MKDNFQQRKKSLLEKEDKSSIGKWDLKVIELCDKINSLDNYYTTSSCSGRIMTILDEDKKGPGLFQFVSHDLVELEDFVKELPSSSLNPPPRSTASPTLGEINLKFKQEPFILHVACKKLDDAKVLMKKAHNVGWKRVGIISLGKNIIVEINGNEKLDFPLVKEGKLLVSEAFLKEVLVKANSNLEKGWGKVEKLRKEF